MIMKCLTRVFLLLFVLFLVGVTYMWIQMREMTPQLHQLSEGQAKRARSRKMSTTADSFIHDQERRQKQLKNFCTWFSYVQHKDFSGPEGHFLSSMVVSHKLMTLYCKPIDVTVRGWEELIQAMELRSDIELDHPIPLDRTEEDLSKYNAEQMTYLLKTYIKIVFVPDPFERLVFLYGQGEETPFEDFIEDVLMEEHRLDGVSSSSVISQCHPCSVKYDYIVLVDSVETDMPHVLNRMGIPESVTLPSIEKKIKEATKWLTLTLFKDLPKKHREQLAKLYSFDFAAFPLKNLLTGNRTLVKSEM